MKHLGNIGRKTKVDIVRNKDIRIITKQEPIITKIKNKLV